MTEQPYNIYLKTATGSRFVCGFDTLEAARMNARSRSNDGSRYEVLSWHKGLEAAFQDGKAVRE